MTSGKSAAWPVHLATFFTEVRPELVLKFAELHGVSRLALASAYRSMRARTGEASPALESVLERLASAS